MAAVQPIPFGVQTYKARSSDASLERCVNLYAEQNSASSSSRVTLYGTPGLSLLATVGDGPIRGLHEFNGLLYAVSGEELYSVDRFGTSSLIGTISGSGQVNMISNASHLVIATSLNAYHTDGVTISTLPETNLNGATYQDGYGIYTQNNTENVWISGVDDLTTIGALDFTTADTLSDIVVGVVSNHRQPWVFGKKSIEIFQNTGDASFPFSRAEFIERGCFSGFSIAKEGTSVFWLGDDLAVYASNGYTPQKISTPPIDDMIGKAAGASTAAGFTYTQLGHTFYVLCFRDLTIVYDITTGLWHERKSNDADRWRASTHSYVFDKNIVGDFENGKIYELDLDTYTDNGESITRTVVAPPLFVNGSRGFMYEFYADFETGVGLNSGQGSDPVAMLSYSDDNGATWSNDLDRSIGGIGEREVRATWSRLGSFRKRHMRLRVSDPVKVAITGAYARIEAGLS